MSRRQSVETSKHIHELQKRVAHLETTTHSGVAHIADGFPEIVDLMHAAAELIDTATPGQGASWDESRGSGDPISSDGKSTAAGRNTFNGRRRLEYWRRRIAGQVEAIRNDLDPNASQTPDPRPRCGKRACEGRGRRQPVGVKVCGFCGKEMGK